MAQVCFVGKTITNTPAIDSLATKVGVLLSDEKVFGAALVEARKPENWHKSNYNVLSMYATIFKQYLSGSCEISYSELIKSVEKWNSNPELQHDSLSIALRDNLLQILPTITEPELKSKALLLLGVIRNNTANISPAKAAVSPAPVVILPDAAPKAALPPVARSQPATVSVDEWLSDEKVFGAKHLPAWNKTENKFNKFFTLKMYLDTLRQYVKGEASEAELKQKIRIWSNSDCFKESLSKIALITLGFQLSASKPEHLDANTSRRVDRAFALLPEISKEPAAQAPKAASAETPAVKAVAAPAPADPIQSSYTVDLTPMDAPTGAVVSRETLGTEITRLATVGGKAYAKELKSDFVFKALPRFEFDNQGYLAKVIFDQVSVENGIDTGAKMQSALMHIAGEWRNIRFEPNAKFPLGKNPSVFTGH